ncbi:hypothetical protein FRC02_011172 [Tulasnella sp. 418]|nr:hypothetical protein FRC02_011172 [Tulasnella sp. 418]
MDDGDVKIAIKVLRVRGGNDSAGTVDRLHKRFYREVLLWRTLRHPNVVPLLGYAVLSDQSPTLVSPWYTNGNVNEYLKSHGDADRRALALDVVNGLQYLHSISIAHGDLKGENVLVDVEGRARLCDFGMSGFIDEAIRITGFTTTNAHMGGTDRFMCPELLEDEPKSTATDVWALGCLILQILTDEVPYQHINRRQAVLSAIMRGELPAKDRGYVIDELLWRCIRACWSKSPNDRPAVADIARCLNPPPCFLPSGDVLLLILKSGLGVDEAIALEQTCKALRLNAQTTQFWLAIARSLFRNRPLPLPPFYESLLELSHLELKKVCLRHHKTTQNLYWTPSPKVMKHKTLVLGRRCRKSSVSRLAFVPGGKYIIATMSDGTFACWDYSVASPIPDNDPNTAPESSGKCLSANVPLATCFIGDGISDWSYQLLSKKREMMVALLTNTIYQKFMCLTFIHVLRLSFSEEGYVQIDHVTYHLTPSNVSWKIYIRDNILYGLRTCSDSGDSVYLYLHEMASNRVCVLKSTVCKGKHMFSGIPLCDNSLLIYRERGEEIHLYRYLDIPQLIRDHGSDAPLGDRTVKYQPNSFTRLPTDDMLPLSPHGQGELPGMRIKVRWAMIHQQSNTTGANKPLSLTAILDRDLRVSHGTGAGKPRVERRYSAFTHLSASLLPTSIPSGDVLESHQQGESISIKSYSRSVRLAQDDFILGGNSSMTCPRLGSDGHHLLLIYGNILKSREVKLRLAVPSSPEEPLGAFHARSRAPFHDLQLGSEIDLDTATDIAMDDGHGIVGVATYRSGDNIPHIHILY